MSRKKLDNRIRILIENGVNTGHRSFFVIVGEKARDQVVLLHHMLRKASVKAQPSVLWCYKKDLDFGSQHRKKKMKKLEHKIKHGKFDINEEDPFDQFIASVNIRYCYYKDTHKILGNTFGMLVLQDFEALTPNLLARTVETIEGGGIVLLLLNSISSRKQLFTLAMDVHSRYRTEAHQDIVGRFNERFILSLSNNKMCMILDDKLNVVPHSNFVKNLASIPPKSNEITEDGDLKTLRDEFQDTQPIGSLINKCKTSDQAKALVKFVDAISEKTLKRTVSLTAARGRGKSAALGLAVAAAVGFGYSNIFLTSPSPENLHTLFDFIFKGFDAMNYEEHTDYELIKSNNPEFNNSVIRVNIFREHRQTIQYIHPKDANRLGQAELVVIDEAAAIPLPLVRQLLGPYLVFMASTINGYEGTGRSLSLKLLEQLRTQSSSSNNAKKSIETIGRTLTECTLNESIRYKPYDCVENWLNALLCLDSSIVPSLSTGCPLPDNCELFYINRDTLFSYNNVTEAFLQRIVSLFVAAHYKNTPNDLQLMSDAPAHHLFCLLGPNLSGNSIPEVFCVIQVCLEGQISKSSIMNGLSQGKRPHGDMIPWNMATQFQDNNFPSLSGARIVRVATHPEYQRMGYGKRALSELERYYNHSFIDLHENESSVNNEMINTIDNDEKLSLLEEVIGPRKNLPPLFSKLSEREPENLDYLGVSYGLTSELLRFWKKLGFLPTYLRQTKSDLTGEHSMIMLKTLKNGKSNSDWLSAFFSDFRRRFINLTGFKSISLSPELSLGILENSKIIIKSELKNDNLNELINPYDMKRLELYSRNMADYHLITDLVPNLARLYFLYEIKEFKLSAMQQVLLIGMGLQYKSIDDLVTEIDLSAPQMMGLFNKMIRRFVTSLTSIQEIEMKEKLLSGKTLSEFKGLEISIDKELDVAAAELKIKQKEEMDKLKHSDFSQYTIKGSDNEWKTALNGKAAKNIISVKTGEKRKHIQEEKSEKTVKKKNKMKDNEKTFKQKKKQK